MSEERVDGDFEERWSGGTAKVCTRCSKELPLSLFQRMQNGARSGVCNNCRYSREGRHRLTDQMLEEARQMFAEGRHMADIARKFGVNASTLYPYISGGESRVRGISRTIVLNSVPAVWAAKRISSRDQWHDPVETLYGYIARHETGAKEWQSALNKIGEDK